MVHRQSQVPSHVLQRPVFSFNLHSDEACDLIRVHHAEGEYSCSPSRDMESTAAILCLVACGRVSHVQMYCMTVRVFSNSLITRAVWGLGCFKFCGEV